MARAALVGHWQLNETTGTTAADISGNANQGTLSGGPTWTTGKVGGGLSFDGVDDIVNAGSGATVDDVVAQGGGGITVAAWIYANNMGESGDGRIVAKGTTPTGGWHFKLGGTNQVEFVVDYTTTDLGRRSAVNTMSTGAWHHVAASWNGSATATNVKIYVDGVEVSSYDLTTNGVGTRVSDASANLYIGNESNGGRTFNGKIDDVRLYNTVQTAADVQILYQSGAVGLMAHWQLNETTGTSAGDVSGNANHGALTGGPTWTTGKVAGGLSFDGVDDIINAGSGGTLDNVVAQGGGGMTVAAWIYANSMGESGDGRIVAKGTSTAGGWHFKLGGTNQVEFVVEHGTTNLTRRSAVNAISTGAWQHVSATWTGSATATNVKIYVGGVEVSSYDITTNGVGARVDDAAANLYIGNESGSGRTFSGVLDEIRIYNRVLTVGEIQALANPPDIATTGLPAGYTTKSYGSQQLTATNGTTPYTWALASGTLPAGLTGPTSGGVISGTPTTAGTASFTVKVTDAVNLTDTQPLSITINANSIPNITTTSLPSAGLGVPYNQAIASTGGDVALVWSVLSGTLPSGVTLSNVNNQNATLSGTPTALGTSNFTLQLADVHSDADTQALSLTVSDVTAPTVAITAPANWTTVSATIALTASATDNVGVVGVQFKLDGANLGAEVASPYTINWDTTPASNGTHILTAVARDAAGNLQTSTAVNVIVSNGGSDSYGPTVQGIANRVSWWRLGETTGTAAVDQNAVQNGVFTGGYTLNQPPLPAATTNRSIALNGSTGYVSVAHNAAYSLATGTLAIWFKPTSLAADFGIFSKNATGLNNGEIYAWYKSSDNTLRIGFQSTGGDTSLVLPGKVQANVRHCLIIRWGNGTPFDAWIARGTTLENLGAHASAAGTLVGNATAWSFGRTADIGATFYLPGTLDDVMVWSRRLTNTEVQTVGTPPPEVAALEAKLNAEYDSGWVSGITNDVVQMYNRYPGIDGLVDLYKATANTVYIDRALDMSLAYLATGADLNPADGYLEWWSTANSTWNHDHYEYRAAMGMSFAVAAVFSDPALSSFVTKATPVRDYLINDFWPKWTGGFTNHANATIVTHFIARFGVVTLNLYRATQNTLYSDWVTTRGGQLKASLDLKANGAYNWETNLKTPPYSTTLDTHHASDTVNFMVEAYLSGLVFDRTDMNRLVLTVKNSTWNQSLTAPLFNDWINGGAPSPAYDDEGRDQGAWIKLARFDSDLRSLYYTWQNVASMWPNEFIRASIYGNLARAIAEAQ
jgi:hypothetical protein